MISKKVLALAAVSLVAGSSAASAQSVRPLSLANGPVAQRASAHLQDDNDFLGRSGWIVGVLVLGILVFVVLEAGKDHPLPDSP